MPDPTSNPALDGADTHWLGDVAARIVRDPHLADDARQEAWLAGASGARSRAQIERGVRRFLYRHWRAARRRATREASAARPEALPSTEELILAQEQRQRVWQELRRLEEPLRTTLLLHYHEDLGTDELARRMGVARSTVTWRIRRGIERLRERLAADERGGGLGALAFALPSARARMSEAVVGSTGTPSLLSLVLMYKTAATLLVIVGLAALVPFLRRDVPPALERHVDVRVGRSHAPDEELALEGLDAARSRASTPVVASALSLDEGVSPAKPPIVELHLSAEGQRSLPERVKARAVVYLTDRSIPIPGPTEPFEVESGTIDVPLGPEVFGFGGETTTGYLEVTAAGFGTQRTQDVVLATANGSVTVVALELSSAETVTVLAVDARSDAALADVVYGVVGPSATFSSSYRSEAGDPVDLALAPSGEEADYLYVHAAGYAIASWSTAELLALPRYRDGSRRLPVAAGCRLVGTLEMESGLAVSEGLELRYSLARGDDLGSIPWPIWMAPRGSLDVDAKGRFESTPLPPGTLTLHLHERGAAHGAEPLSPDYVVELPAAEEHVARLVVPSERRVLTLNLTWGDEPAELPDGGRRALFVELHRAASEGDFPYGPAARDRVLLARRDFVASGEDAEFPLDSSRITQDAPLVLRVGPGGQTVLGARPRGLGGG
ncbi:MAG: sigma-70 family RNA polymerase sigma factor, partial [Planctomycetota bacterium]